MALAYVRAGTNQTVNDSASVSVTLSGASAVGAGNGLIAIVSFNNRASIPSVTVTGGGTWAKDGADVDAAANLRAQVWSCPNATGGDTTITATPTAGIGFLTMIVLEFSGQMNSGWYDVGAGQAQSTGTPTSGATTTRAQNDEVLIGAYCSGEPVPHATDLTATAGSGFTSPTAARALTASGGTLMTSAAEYQIVTATGTQAADWTGLNFSGLALIRTYKAATGVASYEQLAYRWRANDGSLVAP